MAQEAKDVRKKREYEEKLCKYLDDYTQVLIVKIDHVGSDGLRKIREALKGDSVLLMGRNGAMRSIIRRHSNRTGKTAYSNLIPLLVGNVGLLFTNGDLQQVRDQLSMYKTQYRAREGMTAPTAVLLSPGNTSVPSSHTHFFEALNIPTRITNDTVEILTPVELIKEGDIVAPSQVSLLAELRIMPFSSAPVVAHVYVNGSVFAPDVLDLPADELIERLSAAPDLPEVAPLEDVPEPHDQTEDNPLERFSDLTVAHPPIEKFAQMKDA